MKIKAGLKKKMSVNNISLKKLNEKKMRKNYPAPLVDLLPIDAYSMFGQLSEQPPPKYMDSYSMSGQFIF